jgi:predicted enzyme related to lactoylglutathione lyase
MQKKYIFKDYAGFDCGGIEIGLKTWGKLENPRQGEPVIDLLVRDLDKSYRELKDKGVPFPQEPTATPWGARIALFFDPDGNTLQLTEVDWGTYLSASSICTDSRTKCQCTN